MGEINPRLMPLNVCVLYPPQTHQDPKAPTVHKDNVWTEYRGENGTSHALSERDIVEMWA